MPVACLKSSGGAVHLYDLNCHVWPVVKTATTRFQYSGLKFAVLSTRTNRISCRRPADPDANIDLDAGAVDDEERMRRGRSILRMFEGSEARVGWSGGTKMPSWRKDFAFEVRISDEADGERRMIGSSFRDDFDFRERLDRLPAADGVGGIIDGLPGLTPAGY